MHYNHLEPASLKCAIYIVGHENNSSTFKAVMTSKILHKYQKIPFLNYLPMLTGNGNIKVHFWTVTPLMFLQFLFCDTKTRVGIWFRKAVFNQLTF